MLSICITLKDRSNLRFGNTYLRLFPNCINSLHESIRQHNKFLDKKLLYEIVVADYGSTDINLDEFLSGYPIDYRICNMHGGFSRGEGLNTAVEHSKYDHVMLFDSDMFVTMPYIQHVWNAIYRQVAFFPVCYSYKDSQHINGWWRETGHGMAVVRKDQFQKVGGVPVYRIWGQEDVQFFQKISQLFITERYHTPGLFHQWHPK